MAKRKTQEQYVLEASRASPNSEIIGTYQGANKRIAARCKKCGYEWNPVAEYLLQGSGCPRCGGTLRRTHQEFVQELSCINPSIRVRGEYKNNRTKIEVEGIDCGHVWLATPDALLQGHGCPACSKRLKKTSAQFEDELAVVSSSVVALERYEGTHIRISFKCLECNHVWETTPHNVLQGHGCPKCRHREGAAWRRKDPGVFRKELETVNPDIELLEDYRGNKTKINALCKVCGHKWSATPDNLLGGSGCPLCYHNATSFMEQFIAEYFKHVLGHEAVLQRDRELIGMELDIVLPTLRLAIEPGSWAWHHNKVENDLEKRRKCREKGYRLITIYDLYPEHEQAPFSQDCYVFAGDLGCERGNHTLKNLVLEIFESCSGKKRPTESEWQSIARKARRGSRRMSTSEFAERLNSINPDIEVLGEYVNSKTKVVVRCKTCSNQWESTPNSLLQGRGCMKCARKAMGIRNRKSHEQFVLDLERVNDGVIVLGTYVASKKPLHVGCKHCGHEWSPLPNSLLNGQGCPECAKVSMGRKRKTHEQFLADLARVNPDIIVLGEYRGSKDRIRVSCRACGNEWTPTPNSLLTGRGCPICSRKRNGS